MKIHDTFNSLQQRWRSYCIATVVYAQSYATALLFVFGVTLLSGGLVGLSSAQINDPEAASANFGTGAPGAASNFFTGAPRSFIRGPQAAFSGAPQAALAVDPQLGTPNPDVGAQAAIIEDPENLDSPYDDTLQRNAVGNLFKYIEGSFGALVMTATGIGAIIAMSMGAYKAALGILVVAIGAFILRAFVSLFFGADYAEFGGLNGGGGGGGVVGNLP